MYQHSISFFLTISLATNLLFPHSLAVADVRHQKQIKPEIPTPATSITPKAALERLFTSKQIQTEWFAPEFLAQVPIEQVRKVITDVKSQLGTYQTVQKSDQDYLVIFSQGSVPAKIVLNPNCVAATWNNSNAQLEESKFMGFYGGVITQLAASK
jgi:hypothetical protein